MHKLEKRFEQADLPLRVSDKPIVRGSRTEGIFQMTINNEEIKKGRQTEYFAMYTGAKDNKVEVLSVDRKKRQAVLMVKEPERIFFEHVRDKKTGESKEVKRTTDASMRKYLVGHDERQLFISQISNVHNVTTVEDAHKELKPTEIHSKQSKRQGEWFFTEINGDSIKAVDDEIAGGKCVVQKKAPIEKTRGKPHIADERTKVGDMIYVRGKVRHPDHKTVKFDKWVAVRRNTERIENVGVTGWID